MSESNLVERGVSEIKIFFSDTLHGCLWRGLSLEWVSEHVTPDAVYIHFNSISFLLLNFFLAVGLFLSAQSGLAEGYGSSGSGSGGFVIIIVVVLVIKVVFWVAVCYACGQRYLLPLSPTNSSKSVRMTPVKHFQMTRLQNAPSLTDAAGFIM